MAAPVISPELVEWARQAGYSFTAQGPSDAAVFFDGGGELRQYIRADPSGWFALTTGERGDAEQHELTAAALWIVERYCLGSFVGTIRQSRSLPRLRGPYKPEEIAQGFQIVRPDSEGGTSLISPQGGVIVKAGGGSSNVGPLVRLSHYLIADPVDLTTTFLSPDGSPLFAAYNKKAS